MGEKYIAYVGSYSYRGTAKGITIYNVDIKNGRFTKKDAIEVNNSSYLAVSHSKKYLYSIADEGIVSFKILPDGGLEQLNYASIRGMRGCHLSIDSKDRYIFVSGYHDGKATVLRLNPDGTVGPITDGVFHKGMGSAADRSFRPHINCSVLTPDEKYLCVVDLGIDQVLIYNFDDLSGQIQLIDILRCELDSAPRHMIFSKDGKYMYLISEMKNTITIYSYSNSNHLPVFEKLQTVLSAGSKCSSLTAACAIKITSDQKHLLCSNDGDNSVGVFERNLETGLLKQLQVLPISGDYPKDVTIFPDDTHIVSVNHISGILTFFQIDYKTGLMAMCAPPQPVNEPNCCLITSIH